MQKWTQLSKGLLDRILSNTKKFKTLRKKGPPSDWQAEVELVNLVHMTRLNAQFRKKKYPTDILSFPALPIFRQQGILGTLVVCLPVLKKQAKEWNHTPEVELEILLVHGMLHLLDFDHETPTETKKMRYWESQLLKAHGHRGLIKRLLF
jgi:probable rRNA maturation factor